MLKRMTAGLLTLFLLSGCSSTEPYEDQIRELTWRLDAAEKAAEQATVDKRLAEREVVIAQRQARICQERLALANDALREAKANMDENLHDRITELSESNGGGVQPFAISQYGGIVLESGIFFSSGRHELTEAGKRALEGLITALSKPEYADYDIELAGHTDADPIRNSADRYRDNFDLAAMRANSVRRFLGEKGIDPSRLYLSSWGPNHPLAQEKSRNRRVEIVLRKRGEADPAEGTTVPASSARSEGE